MCNSTKIKRERKRLDDMATKVGMPPGWEPIGRDKKGWEWMRKAHEMGWEWGNHNIGGATPSDPLGQRVSKAVATSFANGVGVYVGITLVSSAVRWGWFRAEEWGPRGRDLVLAGNRNHHPDPISAIAEYALLGEATPKGSEPLDDVFGGQWDD